MANTVRLRALTRGERRMLQAKVADRRLPVRLHRRYRLIAEVAQGRSLAAAADRVGCDVTMGYQWVHRFNASGFGTFEQAPNPQGRRPIITGPQIRELIDVALSSPAERGLPFSAWTVPKLAEYCRRRGLLPPITDFTKPSCSTPPARGLNHFTVKLPAAALRSRSVVPPLGR